MLLAALVLGLSCSKTHNAQDDIPQISIVAIKPTTAVQFKDSVIITISYTDGNGDLGDSNPDGKTMKIQDARLTAPDYYHVAPLAPTRSEIRIEGTLKIKVSSLFILGSGDKEITTLALSIRDRAGNWSNVAITPQITITK